MKALIIDDEKRARNILKILIEGNCPSIKEIYQAPSLLEGIEIVKTERPRLIFLDIEMPGLDGLSAARQIAQDPGTPVIILTAHGQPELVEAAIQEGAIQYMLKPVTGPALNAAIQMAVAKARELDEYKRKSAELEATLRDRKLIEKAKGIVMARRNLTEAEAFRFLQRESQPRRIAMAKLAETIVHADELI